MTRAWAADLMSLLRELGAGDGPLGLDRLDTFGFLALRDLVPLVDSSGITMAARDIKTPQEIELLKINGAIGDAIMRDFEDAIRPGIREYELLATLADSLIRQQGEYLFTRLVSSGRNTNPWGSEARDKIVMPGDLVAVDTDAYGYEGYMIDISRTFLCGDVPSAGQVELYKVAHEVMVGMREVLRPGMSYDEFARAAPALPARFQPQQYECMVHGAGLEDESPTIYYPGQAPNPTDVHIVPGDGAVLRGATSARWAASTASSSRTRCWSPSAARSRSARTPTIRRCSGCSIPRRATDRRHRLPAPRAHYRADVDHAPRRHPAVGPHLAARGRGAGSRAGDLRAPALSPERWHGPARLPATSHTWPATGTPASALTSEAPANPTG